MAGQRGWRLAFALGGALLGGVAQGGPMETTGELSVSESGAATYGIPLQLPPGTAGMEPKLALSYNSQTGNGLLGMGWSLSGLSAITRCPQTLAQDGQRVGVNFSATDRLCLDGQRLILVGGTYGAPSSEYRTERDTFSKIVANGGSTGDPSSFTVWTKAGQILQYGNTTDSRIEAQGKSAARVWAINKISDTKGNYLSFSYTEDNANGDYTPARIDYTGNGTTPTSASVQFAYESRPDVASLYTTGSVVKGLSRMTAIKTYTGTTEIKEYRLTYDPNPPTGRSRITAIQECAMPSNSCKPAISFTWSGGGLAFSVSDFTHGLHFGSPPQGYYQTIEGDFNGDGKADFLELGQWSYITMLSNGDGTFSHNGGTHGWNLGNPPGNYYQFLSGDFNGDGKTDFIGIYGNSYFLFLSNGDGTFTTSTRSFPNGWNFGTINNSYTWNLGDINGDGRTDLLVYDTASASGAYYVLTSNGDGNFTGTGGSTGFPLYSVSTAGTYGGQVQLSDFDGDGKADLMIYTASGYQTISAGCGFWGCATWQQGVGPFKTYSYHSNGDGTLTLSRTTQTGSSSSGTSWPSFDLFTASIRQMDVNADGIADYLSRVGTSQSISISDGTGWPVANTTATGLADLSAYQMVYGDFNGDGRTDYVGLNGSSVYTGISKGDGSFTESSGSLPVPVPTNSQLIQGDFNGDGRMDIAYVTDYDVVVYQANAPTPDLITTINNGLGANSTITYKPLTDSSVYTKGSGASYPQQDIQAPMYVASQVQVPNGAGGTLTKTFRYGALKVDVSGRNLGFGTLQATQVDTNLTTTTTYSQQWPYVGLPTQVQKTLGGSQLSLINNTYSCLNPGTNSACSAAAGNRYFPYLSQSVENTWDLNGVALPTVTTTNSGFDIYGNVGTVSVATSDGYSKSTANTYATADTTNWILGRLTQAQVTATGPATTAPAAAPTPQAPPSGAAASPPMNVSTLMTILQLLLDD